MAPPPPLAPVPVARAALAAAEAHLAAADPVLATLIATHGPCSLAREQDLFAALVDSIIGQQLSVKAAATIAGRLRAALPGGALAADAILALPDDALRGAGLSRAKAAYLRDLAGHVTAGTLDLAALDTQTDDAVTAALVAVKGIGPWTAQMFLIFALGRLDVLPVADLGLREAAVRAYSLPARPTAADLTARAVPWRPYRSIATWYLWRSLGNAPGQ